MLPKERTKILKLLALTASSHEGEALAASRMANKLLKRAGTSWAEFFAESATGNIEPEPGYYREHATAETEAAPGAYASSSARSPNFGADIFGDEPAWIPAPPPRSILAGRVRLFLARIPWPARLLLGPLAAAGYLTAWTLDGDDSTERSSQAVLSGFIVLVLTAGWLQIIKLLLTGHWPI